MDSSAVAVTFQSVGTLLLALTMAQLGRTFAWRYARQWALAWTALFVALLSVRLYIETATSGFGRGWWFIYLFAEWMFLVLLYAGCREVIDRQPRDLRPLAGSAPAAAIVAVLIISISNTFDDLFIVQAGIVSIGAFTSFHTLGRAGDSRRTVGWQSMRLSLALMTILYAAYVPLFAIHTRISALPFLPYSPLADLLAAVLVGFSMVLMASEEAQFELRDAVAALQVARDQLEQQLNTDPLTQALSRHAFRVVDSGMSGTVIMVDIDHLKWVNDHEGHISGDAVIRAAANAIRSRIRADDLLFRWGGDEFLVIMPGSRMELVRERLAPLSSGFTVRLQGEEAERTYHLSWGGAEFGGTVTLDEAIQLADESMYERRTQQRRGQLTIVS